MVLCVALLTGSQGPITQVGRIIGATAAVGEAAASMATVTLGAASNITSSASDIVLSVAANTLSAGDNAWHGLDLWNVTATRCSGSVTVASSYILEHWLESNLSLVLMPCLTDNSKSVLASAAQSLAVSMPHLFSEHELMLPTSNYHSHLVKGLLLSSTQLQVSFDFIEVSFDLTWANPIWDWAGFAYDQEREQLSVAVQRIIHAMPNVSLALYVEAETDMHPDVIAWLWSGIQHIIPLSSFEGKPRFEGSWWESGTVLGVGAIILGGLSMLRSGALELGLWTIVDDPVVEVPD
jgi:hypothetical protein